MSKFLDDVQISGKLQVGKDLVIVDQSGNEKSVSNVVDTDGVTTFNADGSITKTKSDGSKIVTAFPSSNVITETTYDSSEEVVSTKTTTFESDGSISEVTV